MGFFGACLGLLGLVWSRQHSMAASGFELKKKQRRRSVKKLAIVSPSKRVALKRAKRVGDPQKAQRSTRRCAKKRFAAWGASLLGLPNASAKKAVDFCCGRCAAPPRTHRPAPHAPPRSARTVPHARYFFCAMVFRSAWQFRFSAWGSRADAEADAMWKGAEASAAEQNQISCAVARKPDADAERAAH